MDFWLIRNGEKTGPLPDYEIRSKIESGELGPEDPAWSEGLPSWTPLKSIPLFQEFFERPVEMAEPEAHHGFPTPPPLPEKPAVYRRFWARWFDLLGYGSLWWLAMSWSGNDLKTLVESPWLMLMTHLVPWFLIESAMIHHFGTTPGKALMSLSVANDDGSRLTYGQSLRRSFRVLVSGIGCGFPLVSPLCQILNLVMVKRLGTTLWDRAGGHRVKVGNLAVWKISVLVIGMFVAIQIEGTVLAPVMVEMLGKDFPELKELYDKTRK